MPDRDRFGGSEREYSVPQRTVEPGTAFNRPLGWQRSGPATGLVDYDDYQDRVRRGDTYTGDRISTPSTRVEPPGSAFGRGQGWQRAGPATGLVDYEDYLRRIQGGQGDMDSGSYLSSRYGGGLDDTAFMGPNPFPPFDGPFPGPGGPFGPFGPDIGPFVGEPEGGEFDVAQADFNWRTWQKLKEKFGQGSADQYMESFNVNRGGIMGVI